MRFWKSYENLGKRPAMDDWRTYQATIQALHKHWIPHVGQVEVGHHLFQLNDRSIFVQCGRKWGKTEMAVYILWRWAMLYPNSACYYIAPQLNQAREIVWADPRLQSFGPREWLADINNTEMRLKFKNGSFIKVDGSDNYDKMRGIRPGLIVMEEFKDHRKEFMEVMRPNLAVYDAPVIYIGTPPKDMGDTSENEYLKVADEHKATPGRYYHHAPTWENPHISKAWLEQEKQSLIARGEIDVWETEYGANYVKGGAHKIFPMLTRDVVRRHSDILRHISKDLGKMEWYCVADPAGATCFGVLFGGINPYTREVYLLDEIYETSQSDMTVRCIGPKIESIIQELSSRSEWRRVYDEAATWFMNEMVAEVGTHWEPTQKSRMDKISGLSMIKDIMLAGKLVISDRCEKLYWEMDKYRKDTTGKIPKKDDHLIDCLRYLLDAAYYSSHESVEFLPEKDEMWRGARFEDDFPHLREDGFHDEWGIE